MSARWGSVLWGTSRWAQRGVALTGTVCAIGDREETVCDSAVSTQGGGTDVANEYILGNVIRIDATFKNNGVLVSPSNVLGKIKTPSGVYHEFELNDDLVQTATGTYHFTYQPAEEGRYEYRIAGLNTNMAAAEGHFTIVESFFN